MTYVSEAGDDQSGCFLCDRARPGDDDPHVVERTATTLTILNRFPYSSGHVLVAPLRHVPDITALVGDEGALLMEATRRAVAALTAAMHPEGFNIGINHGRAAGASIEHLHVHVVPRWAGDTNFMPALADIKVLPEHLLNTAEKLREAFAGTPRGGDTTE